MAALGSSIVAYIAHAFGTEVAMDGQHWPLTSRSGAGSRSWIWSCSGWTSMCRAARGGLELAVARNTCLACPAFRAGAGTSIPARKRSWRRSARMRRSSSRIGGPVRRVTPRRVALPLVPTVARWLLSFLSLSTSRRADGLMATMYYAATMRCSVWPTLRAS